MKEVGVASRWVEEAGCLYEKGTGIWERVNLRFRGTFSGRISRLHRGAYWQRKLGIETRLKIIAYGDV